MGPRCEPCGTPEVMGHMVVYAEIDFQALSLTEVEDMARDLDTVKIKGDAPSADSILTRVQYWYK